jgi:hypothetical protein
VNVTIEDRYGLQNILAELFSGIMYTARCTKLTKAYARWVEGEPCHTSRGTAAYGCCCTFIDVGTTSSPAEPNPALAALVPTCTV